MTFTVPEATKAEPFTFRLPDDDTEHEIPRAKDLSIGMVEKLDRDPFNGFLDVVGGSDSPTGAAIRSLTAEQFEALMKAWENDSGITRGKSAASSPS